MILNQLSLPLTSVVVHLRIRNVIVNRPSLPLTSVVVHLRIRSVILNRLSLPLTSVVVHLHIQSVIVNRPSLVQLRTLCMIPQNFYGTATYRVYDPTEFPWYSYVECDPLQAFPFTFVVQLLTKQNPYLPLP